MFSMDITFTLSELQRVGLTQTKIAEELGLKQPTVSAMIAGKAGVTRPSYKVISGLHALAEKHGVPMEPPREVDVPSPEICDDAVCGNNQVSPQSKTNHGESESP
jgi:transcriptional regulator with XRE-family HTH domain